MHAALVIRLLHSIASMLSGLADLGGHRQTHGRSGLQPGHMCSLQAFHKAARLYILSLSCSACIRLLCVAAEEEEQEKAQAAVKAEKAKKEKQKNKKAKQKVTVSGIWQEVYNSRSLTQLLLLGLLNKHIIPWSSQRAKRNSQILNLTFFFSPHQRYPGLYLQSPGMLGL